MQLTFNSVEELRAFVKDHLKGTRGAGKNSGNDDGDGQPIGGNAPQPIQPPPNTMVAGGQQAPNFAPAFGQQQPPTLPGAFAPPPPNGFGTASAGAAPGVDPAIASLVQRINARLDGAIASGQSVDDALKWFRSQCGAEAANATLEQIKTQFLFKVPQATLENIARTMAA